MLPALVGSFPVVKERVPRLDVDDRLDSVSESFEYFTGNLVSVNVHLAMGSVILEQRVLHIRHH